MTGFSDFISQAVLKAILPSPDSINVLLSYGKRGYETNVKYISLLALFNFFFFLIMSTCLAMKYFGKHNQINKKHCHGHDDVCTPHLTVLTRIGRREGYTSY